MQLMVDEGVFEISAEAQLLRRKLQSIVEGSDISIKDIIENSDISTEERLEAVKKARLEAVKKALGQRDSELIEEATNSIYQVAPGKMSTIFSQAVEIGDFKLVKYFLKKGADIDHPEDSPIEAAIAAGNVEMVKFLYQNGAKHNQEFLITAIEQEKPEIADYILYHKGYDAKQDKKQKILFAAIEADNLKLVNMLLDGGADVNATNGRRGLSPLGVAIMHSTPEIVQLLLERGANPHQLNSPLKIPPLAQLCFRNDQESILRVAETLVAYGANPGAQIDMHGKEITVAEYIDSKPDNMFAEGTKGKLSALFDNRASVQPTSYASASHLIPLSLRDPDFAKFNVVKSNTGKVKKDEDGNRVNNVPYQSALFLLEYNIGDKTKVSGKPFFTRRSRYEKGIKQALSTEISEIIAGTLDGYAYMPPAAQHYLMEKIANGFTLSFNEKEEVELRADKAAEALLIPKLEERTDSHNIAGRPWYKTQSRHNNAAKKEIVASLSRQIAEEYTNFAIMSDKEKDKAVTAVIASVEITPPNQKGKITAKVTNNVPDFKEPSALQTIIGETSEQLEGYHLAGKAGKALLENMTTKGHHLKTSRFGKDNLESAKGMKVAQTFAELYTEAARRLDISVNDLLSNVSCKDYREAIEKEVDMAIGVKGGESGKQGIKQVKRALGTGVKNITPHTLTRTFSDTGIISIIDNVINPAQTAGIALALKAYGYTDAQTRGRNNAFANMKQLTFAYVTSNITNPREQESVLSRIFENEVFMSRFGQEIKKYMPLSQSIGNDPKKFNVDKVLERHKWGANILAGKRSFGDRGLNIAFEAVANDVIENPNDQSLRSRPDHVQQGTFSSRIQEEKQQPRNRNGIGF